jgi:vacuolar-type H+-ATPase subunit E/Vma4
MSQNTLIEKIKNDAAQAVKDIKAQSVAEVDAINRAVEAEIAELRKRHEAELAKKTAHLELVAVSKAKQAGKIAVQSAKRKQIDAIIASVAKELAEQPTDDYVKLFTSLVGDIVPANVAITSVTAPKSRMVETATILSNAGLTGEVTTEGNFLAGLIITSDDGVYDVTLERLMNDKRAELEMVVVNKVGV